MHHSIRPNVTSACPGETLSHDNTITNNVFSNVRDLVIANSSDNRFSHMRELMGYGLAFKESSQVTIEDNSTIH